MTDELMIQTEITDKADTMREAAAELARSYAAEGNFEMSLKVDQLFDDLSDESAARLLDILRKCFRQ